MSITVYRVLDAADRRPHFNNRLYLLDFGRNKDKDIEDIEPIGLVCYYYVSDFINMCRIIKCVIKNGCISIA